MSTRKPTKPPAKTNARAKSPAVEAARAPVTPEAPAPGSNLAGVVLRVGVYKKPNCYRPYVHVTYDGVRFTKMVPGGRSATKEEALAKADAYRARIIADDVLPPARSASGGRPATSPSPTPTAPPSRTSRLAQDGPPSGGCFPADTPPPRLTTRRSPVHAYPPNRPPHCSPRLGGVLASRSARGKRLMTDGLFASHQQSPAWSVRESGPRI